MIQNPFKRAIVVITVLMTCPFLASPLRKSWRAIGSTILTENEYLKEFPKREAAYRENNIGVALLEQFRYKEAIEAFRRALEIDNTLSIGRINLAIGLYNLPDLAASQAAVEDALKFAPRAPQLYYVLGLIAKSQNHPDQAIEAFKKVLEIDPRDVGSKIIIGQIYSQQRKYTEAVAYFRAALAIEPYSETALYNIATALLRSGQRSEGEINLKKFQSLRDSGAGTVIGINYLEQGRYAEAIASTGLESNLVDPATPDVRFDSPQDLLDSGSIKSSALSSNESLGFTRKVKHVDLTRKKIAELAFSLSSRIIPIDYDSDGDLDILGLNGQELELLRNTSGKFLNVTTSAGALTRSTGVAGVIGVATCAIAGDFDNDTRPDLFIVRYGGPNSLYHNEGDGKFSDVTKQSGITDYPFLSISAAFADIDHDGDIDIFIAGFADPHKSLNPGVNSKSILDLPADFAGAPNQLWRNDGNGHFTDISSAARINLKPMHATAVVPTDYDNRRDVDLLVANYGAVPSLFRNLRDSTFRDVAAETGLGRAGNYTSIAAGDINKDGFIDFYFGADDGSDFFALSNGHERFTVTKTTSVPAAGEVSLAEFIDYDNDGLLDLLTLQSGKLHLWRSISDKWVDVTDRAFASHVQTSLQSRALVSADIDGDGDSDLIFISSPSDELQISRNLAGDRNHSVTLRLSGTVSNRSGVQAKVEMRAGSLIHKLEVYSASPAPAASDISFGLGPRQMVDAIRVTWPAGIIQTETELTGQTSRAEPTVNNAAHRTIKITEVDRKPSSCPFLFAWNGRRFGFVTDFQSSGEISAWLRPGVFSLPDPDEYVRIRDDQLKDRDGHFDLRMTYELEEAYYVDRVQLIAIDHPSGTEVFPDEGMRDPPPPFKLFVARNLRSPVAAFDSAGQDILAEIKHLDRKYAQFPLHRIRGFAEPHTLTLDLGQMETDRIVLFLTGWMDYVFSSDNVAAAQSGIKQIPPTLQVKDARGRWRTVIKNIGLPIGHPQTVTVDLRGKFLSKSREVRIVTNLRLFWDQIQWDETQIATLKKSSPVRITRLNPVAADLHWRGYSTAAASADGPDEHEPYDYSLVTEQSPWKVLSGFYTREGDVLALLLKTDDRLAVARTGDEISLSFDATRLNPLQDGWKRTFLFYSNGFSKEMDINSGSPDQLSPLPFHGMTEYPFKRSSARAREVEARRRDDTKNYNTRFVTQRMPQLLFTRR